MTPPRKLVIIGGVAGGATAAARARRLCESAEIVVFERGPYPSFANCGMPYHIGGEIADREKLFLQTPASLKARHNLDVRVRSEVIVIDRAARRVTVRRLDDGREYAEPYDKLIISTGAAPIRPPLPGIDHPAIFSLRSIPDMDRIRAAAESARDAVVVGGGFIGLEMAENLRRRGLNVHVVEMLDQVMPPLDREMAEAIHAQLRLHGVALRLSSAVESFADASGRVIARLKGGESIEADLVVLAIGVRPESALAKQAGLDITERGAIRVDEHLRTSDPNIYAVGDVVVTRDAVTGGEAFIPLAGPANRQGRIAADHIFGRDSRYRGSQGTSIVRVFDLVVAMTGASEKTLRRAGLAYEKVYVHPAHHVGYFPGATPMSIKLLFAKPDGRVLGAQITGREGVDKRIDVLATAIQARMTVFDLEEMELAYAPQFGAAKDPINMAGFVAANVLRGDVRIVHADALDGAVLIDVRTPAEHDAGAIPGSTLIPIDELRARIAQVPRDGRVVVYCAVGQRGYTAARILAQLGYDVANLSGGYRTYVAYHPPTRAASAAPTPAAPPSPAASNAAPSSAAPAACAPRPQAGGSPSATAELDVRGCQCPGPIVAIRERIDGLADGDVLSVRATDPGFAADVPAWCRQTGHELVELRPENGHTHAWIRKRAASPDRTARAEAPRDKTLIVFSSDLDRVMAAFIIANGAAAMGQKVTMFFTFWGLNVLRRADAVSRGKPLLDRLFGWMMPRGPARLALSRMNMAGLGTAMMKHVMRRKQVEPLAALMERAVRQGVRLVACAMSMDVMGIRREELIDGVELGGVGSYLDATATANANLFI